MQHLIKKEQSVLETFPETENWYPYTLGKSGYIQNISIKNMLEICEKHNTKLYFVLPKGLFAPSHAVFLKSEKVLDEKLLHSIISNMSFARGELVTDNYALGFKLITEIAVKAMSPGINDPGTAINAVDYLTELFSLRMKKKDREIYIKDDVALLRLATVNFSEILYYVMASLRTYCQHDPIMVKKLLWMLDYLKEQTAVDNKFVEAINTERRTLLEQAKDGLDSERDIKELGAVI